MFLLFCCERGSLACALSATILRCILSMLEPWTRERKYEQSKRPPILSSGCLKSIFGQLMNMQFTLTWVTWRLEQVEEHLRSSTVSTNISSSGLNSLGDVLHHGRAKLSMDLPSWSGLDPWTTNLWIGSSHINDSPTRMESTLSVGYTQSRIWTYLGASGHALPSLPLRILLSSLRTRGEADCLALCR